MDSSGSRQRDWQSRQSGGRAGSWGAQGGNVGDSERALSAIAGGLMGLWGLRRGGVFGSLMALLGGSMVARGVSGRCPVYQALDINTRESSGRGPGTARGEARTVKSVLIHKPRQEVYRFWRDFRNLARIMPHIERIDVLSPERSHWVVRAPAGTTVEWDSVVTEDRPGERIAWKTEPGADVTSSGWVQFHDAEGGRATQVTANIRYEPPAGEIGRMVAKLFGEEPEVQAQEDLDRLKQVMESGEIPHTASPSSLSS